VQFNNKFIDENETHGLWNLKGVKTIAFTATADEALCKVV
jgi:hypothetical protein